MKRVAHYFLMIVLSITVFSCAEEYDDTFLREEIDKLKEDLASLKSQVSSIQTVVDALNEGKVITNVELLDDDKGHKITFNDGTTIEVLNGEKAPVIGIESLDGIYYWTITTNGETTFLLDNDNNKLPVTGNNGLDGNDGHTPQLAIDGDGYWTVDGERIKDADGNYVEAQGDSFFKEIIDGEESVTFVLADESTIVIPKSGGTYLKFDKSIVVFNAGQTQMLRFKYENIVSFEIIDQPEGWTTNIHLPNKYVNVVAPSDGFGMGEIKLQGLDENGQTYLAKVTVTIAGSGFSSDEGVFILNEGNMTTENGSLIFITPNGQVYDKVYQNANGSQLGNVTQDMFFHDGKVYFISQNGTTNPVGTSFENDGMLIVADAETLKKVAAYTDELSELSWPTHVAVLDESNIFIRDNNGVHRFNSTTGELQLVSGTQGAAKNRMAVVDGKVFYYAGKNLCVLEKDATTLSQTISFEGNISGIEKSKDGQLWVASPGKISKVNATDYSIIKTNEISIGSVGNSVFATPGITTKGDTIYYGGGSLSIYRHIFSTGESKEMIDKTTLKSLVPDANMVYNSMAVHPVTGKVYLNTIKGYGWSFLINNISVFDFDNTNAESPLYANYRNYTHFPAGIFFPANFK